MTRPHEEDWCPGVRDGCGPNRDGHYICRVSDGRTLLYGGSEEATARLAAQAPAMARLLLETYRENASRCEPDCRLVTVLRAAGVLP